MKFFWTKKIKKPKQSHAYKGYPSSYDIDMLNSFNPELLLKDTDSAIRNKLKYLLSESRGFKFLTKKRKPLLMKVILMMYLNQNIPRLY